MPRYSDRKKRELRAEELRAILDPAGHANYQAELSRLEQWLTLDDELRAGTATERKRGRPKGSVASVVVKRKPGRPKGSTAPVVAKRKRGRPKKVAV